MKHPNAAVSGISGVGLGGLVVWALAHAGVHVSPVEAAAIAGAIGSAALFVGRNGAVGTWKFVRKTVLYGKKPAV